MSRVPSPALSAVERPPATLTDIAYARIREAIVTRELPPGARVTELGVAKRLAMSKTPVREALVRLREVGLIERGNTVISQSPDALRDAYELREVLEPFTARAAARRASASGVRPIATAAAETLACARSGDVAGFRAADVAFHEAIAAAAANPRVRKTIGDTLALIGVLTERDLAPSQTFVDLADSHVAIAEAIARGDEDSAAHEMGRHIRLVERHLLGADRRR